jgi:hypothetical protein
MIQWVRITNLIVGDQLENLKLHKLRQVETATQYSLPVSGPTSIVWQ